MAEAFIMFVGCMLRKADGTDKICNVDHIGYSRERISVTSSTGAAAELLYFLSSLPFFVVVVFFFFFSSFPPPANKSRRAVGKLEIPKARTLP
jgi:hypothetical protein